MSEVDACPAIRVGDKVKIMCGSKTLDGRIIYVAHDHGGCTIALESLEEASRSGLASTLAVTSSRLSPLGAGHWVLLQSQ